jgi:hypothetical protein
MQPCSWSWAALPAATDRTASASQHTYIRNMQLSTALYHHAANPAEYNKVRVLQWCHHPHAAQPYLKRPLHSTTTPTYQALTAQTNRTTPYSVTPRHCSDESLLLETTSLTSSARPRAALSGSVGKRRGSWKESAMIWRQRGFLEPPPTIRSSLAVTPRFCMLFIPARRGDYRLLARA